jgi:hypothetical protein
MKRGERVSDPGLDSAVTVERSQRTRMRGATRFRPYLIFGAGVVSLALAALLLLPPPAPVRAQDAPPVAAQLNAGRSSSSLPAEGFYVVNDDFKFTLARRFGITLLRFAGNDEVFVLSSERAPLGGRVLKYDTGDVALQVTGYGGVTIYTSTAPGGLPAERTGDAELITFNVLSLPAVRTQAQQMAAKLRQTHGLALAFSVDWSRLDDAATRFLALDTMRNIARAIGGLCADRHNQSQFAARLRTVRVVPGAHPMAVYRSGVLTVTFAPDFGLRGRMSSLALARAMRTWL